MLDLTEPIQRGSRIVLFIPRTLRMAVASIGSPTRVPVPCASTKPQAFGSRPAFLYTCLIRSSVVPVSGWFHLEHWVCLPCALPLGIVIPGVLPSWFRPVPAMTARMGSLSLIA